MLGSEDGVGECLVGSRHLLNDHHLIGSEVLLSKFIQDFGEMNLEEWKELDSRDWCSALLEALTWEVWAV